jgi:antitoxin ParD1/3/4
MEVFASKRRAGLAWAPDALCPDIWYIGGMSKNTSFSVGGHFSGFIEAQVNEGRDGSTSDVVRGVLRLPEEREVKVAALRAALIKGEESGVSDRTVDDIWATVKAQSDFAGE